MLIFLCLWDLSSKPWLFSATSSEYDQYEINCSDALQSTTQNRLHQSAQSTLSIKQDIDKDKEGIKVTNINYYISSNDKENQQSCQSKLFKVLSRQAVNILYGILGSIVASALSGAIYSIVNSASGHDGIMFGNNLTTRAFTHSQSSWTSFNGNKKSVRSHERCYKQRKDKRINSMNFRGC